MSCFARQAARLTAKRDSQRLRDFLYVGAAGLHGKQPAASHQFPEAALRSIAAPILLDQPVVLLHAIRCLADKLTLLVRGQRDARFEEPQNPAGAAGSGRENGGERPTVGKAPTVATRALAAAGDACYRLSEVFWRAPR